MAVVTASRSKCVEGYELLQFEVLITPGETVTYKGEMKRIQ